LGETESLSDKLIRPNDLLLKKAEFEKQSILKIAELNTKVILLESKEKKYWWKKKQISFNI